MKTYEIVALANKDGMTYRCGKFYYNKERGFSDCKEDEWLVDNFNATKLNYFINLEGWQKCHTNQGKIVLDYLELCGFKYLARDGNGGLYAFKENPIKEDSCRMWFSQSSHDIITKVFYDLPFVTRDRDEPYDILKEKEELSYY